MVDVSVIKKRLRITHDRLDDQFEQDIAQAKEELKRVGVSAKKVDSPDDKLIDRAIIAYCMKVEADTAKESEGYSVQWVQCKDELRKSSGYKA